jgi:hypothetical protein
MSMALKNKIKLHDVVDVVADYGADPTGVADSSTAVQNAINSGAKRVRISFSLLIASPLVLAANQILDFDGGSLTTTAGISAPNGILYGNAKANVRIIDPIIDASATAGVGGINLVDCPNGRVEMGVLTKCNLNLQSSSTSTRMGYKVRGTVVNMASWVTATAVYMSAVKGASLIDVEAFSGKEGFGIYNGSTNIKHSNCESYSHAQDGFVLIAGTQISYTGCFAYSNGQSGFTTQRQTASSNVLNVTYSSCEAYSNSFDGFDIRGATSASWAVPIRVALIGCLSYSNLGTGFYIVYAEGTTLTGCIATQNLLQGFFVDGSTEVSLGSCQSNSNASTVAAGSSKAGIIFFNSTGGSAVGCYSANTVGVTQNYGISFTGTTVDCSVVGGYYQNNSTGPFFGANLAYFAGVAIQTTGNVWVDTITGNTGAYSESGFGVPTHTRQKGSMFRRTDGANGEVYISNGGGSWTIR